MPRSSSAISSPAPALAWAKLAMHSGEMLFAAMQVIQHRTTRMMTAGLHPSARDRKEFTRMGEEKVEAAMESAMAMSMRYALAQQQFVLGWWNEVFKSAGRMMQASLAPANQQMQWKHFQSSGHAFKGFGELFAALIGSGVHIGQHGLRPIHSRATNNAKRLGKLNPVGGKPFA
jgi:hypothetical protein